MMREIDDGWDWDKVDTRGQLSDFDPELVRQMKEVLQTNDLPEGMIWADVRLATGRAHFMWTEGPGTLVKVMGKRSFRLKAILVLKVEGKSDAAIYFYEER